MIKKHTIEEKQELYEKLSKQNKSLFWDEGVSARIKKSITRFNLTDEQSNILFEILGNLFIGTLLPSQLPKIIEQEIPIENSNNLSQEIIRFVIYPIHHVLRSLYADEEFDKIGVKKDFTEKERKEWQSEFGDTYREPIE